MNYNRVVRLNVFVLYVSFDHALSVCIVQAFVVKIVTIYVTGGEILNTDCCNCDLPGGTHRLQRLF
jgi:hypothetical protein